MALLLAYHVLMNAFSVNKVLPKHCFIVLLRFVSMHIRAKLSEFDCCWYPGDARNTPERCSSRRSLKWVSPMFTRPYAPQSICSPLYDISPYVSHGPQSLCYPEMFPSPVAPQTYITQSLCFPVPMFPIFPSPYVSQSLCSPAPVLPSTFVSHTL